jgi:hypothetical protein
VRPRRSRHHDEERERPRRYRQRGDGGNIALWVIGGVVLGAVALGTLLYLPARWKVQEARRRIDSQNNLKKIGLAAHNHHDAKGHFPANIRDARGRPLLSWRVLLLPYLEQAGLYQQFNLDEPWDSEHNRALLTKMPKVYIVPGREKEARDGLTFYQGFAGPGTVFDPKVTRLTLGGITDGTSNTILAVEAAEAVPWTRPEDLPCDPNEPLPRLGGHFKGGFNVLLCDGTSRFIQASISETTLRNAITRGDGQTLGSDW